MFKKIVISTLVIILLGAVVVGAVDIYNGNSSLEIPKISLSANAAGRSDEGGWNQSRGNGQGQGQSRGQGGGQGQGQNNGTGTPQAMVDKEWVTVSGSVVGIGRNITVDTAEMGQLAVEIGPPWFAAEQAVTFNAGDAVTLVGFAAEGGKFQAGEITNDTTGATLYLRDPNGRPLWAGRGGQGGGQGQGGNGF
jgi:hypothetical protein